MQVAEETGSTSSTMLWAGRSLSALVVVFMLFDGLTKLLKVPQVMKAHAELGWPQGQASSLGVLVLICTAVYVFPRTSILGAILLTAFLGGATAAKARIEDPTLIFSVVVGMLVWGGLFLRDARLRALVPLRKDY